jgi:hypothetical protein
VRIVLSGVAKGRRGRALPATSLAYTTGRATLAIAETEQRPTVLGLLASGRMRPDAGTVFVDGSAEAARIRRAIALVDAPLVSEPHADVPVAGVAAEELMFAGRPSDPLSVRRWLEGAGFGAVATTPVAHVTPIARIRLLCELALLREGVEGVVLVSPDRHGGAPADWWRYAQGLAARGLAVLVIAGHAAHTALESGRSRRSPRPSRLRMRAGTGVRSR